MVDAHPVDNCAVRPLEREGARWYFPPGTFTPPKTVEQEGARWNPPGTLFFAELSGAPTTRSWTSSTIRSSNRTPEPDQPLSASGSREDRTPTRWPRAAEGRSRHGARLCRKPRRTPMEATTLVAFLDVRVCSPVRHLPHSLPRAHRRPESASSLAPPSADDVTNRLPARIDRAMASVARQ